MLARKLLAIAKLVGLSRRAIADHLSIEESQVHMWGVTIIRPKTYAKRAATVSTMLSAVSLLVL